MSSWWGYSAEAVAELGENISSNTFLQMHHQTATSVPTKWVIQTQLSCQRHCSLLSNSCQSRQDVFALMASYFYIKK